MRAVLQRVHEAQAIVNNETVGKIGKGILVLLAIHKNDNEEQARQLAQKILHLRIFPDHEGKMNINVIDAQGSALIVSQFTLYGDTKKGNRPSYASAALPEKAKFLYELFVSECRRGGIPVGTGTFQAHMDVHLVNDGPVTLLCDAES
jgi:D-aminoacyl-tRNA deacylase